MEPKIEEKRTKKIEPETFLLLVKQLRHFEEEADIFEVDLDKMKVKGDLKVIRKTFPQKEFIAKSHSLDLLKRASSAGWGTIKMPATLEVDNEFKTLVKNRGTKVLILD